MPQFRKACRVNYRDLKKITTRLKRWALEAVHRGSLTLILTIILTLILTIILALILTIVLTLILTIIPKLTLILTPIHPRWIASSIYLPKPRLGYHSSPSNNKTKYRSK